MASPKNDQFTSQLVKSPFWESKSLSDMTRQEWEAICDGCGKCCLHKFIEDDSEEDIITNEIAVDDSQLHYTNIACYLFDEQKCQCSQYQNRSELVPDCVTLTPENIDQVYFMPPSCSYRRLYEGRGLASWHPLLNKGRKAKMHKADISAKDKTVSEHDVKLEHFEDYIVMWPLHDKD